MKVINIRPKQLQKLLNSEGNVKPILIDVRERWEFDLAKIDGSVLVPMQEVPDRKGQLDREKSIVCICHHGMRSYQVATYLATNGFDNVFNLQGGIDAWSLSADPSVPRY